MIVEICPKCGIIYDSSISNKCPIHGEIAEGIDPLEEVSKSFNKDDVMKEITACAMETVEDQFKDRGFITDGLEYEVIWNEIYSNIYQKLTSVNSRLWRTAIMHSQCKCICPNAPNCSEVSCSHMFVHEKNTSCQHPCERMPGTKNIVCREIKTQNGR